MHNNTKTHSESVLNPCYWQVWDKSESGEWHCTASWKVNHLMLLDPILTWTGFPGKTIYPPMCLHDVIIHYITFPIFARLFLKNVDTSYNLQGLSIWANLFCLQTHSGSVWRVTWAHPEFGQVLASCSFDRTAAVWEEIVGESNDKQRGLSHWVCTTLISAHAPKLSFEPWQLSIL